jgi:hypothetical protein
MAERGSRCETIEFRQGIDTSGEKRSRGYRPHEIGFHQLMSRDENLARLTAPCAVKA